MSDLVEFAEAELARAKGQDKNILGIIKMLAGQDCRTLASIRRLLNWRPITPLTGEEDEWDGDRNKRYRAVFREPDGTAYDSEGRIFTFDNGKTWYINKERGRVPITFPYYVPICPIRVYKYRCEGEFEAPLHIRWTRVCGQSAEGELYGNPNLMARYKIVGDEVVRV